MPPPRSRSRPEAPSTPGTARAVDAGEFRRVLGHYATGVVVVTARCPDGTLAGLAVGSFTSVSLDPPLVAFLPAKTSSSWPRIGAGRSFCANILGAGQEDLVRRFAAAGGDKFAGLGWVPSPLGHPVLPGVPAWVECDLHRVDDAGDHLIVLGLVRALHASGNSPGPLVFFRGALGRFVAGDLGSATSEFPDWDGSLHRSWWW
jgi:3-hydroxy-9,10-secoandrosta-1,3,5(10)-triene-9,17-dione monooxygenase reductase component